MNADTREQDRLRFRELHHEANANMRAQQRAQEQATRNRERMERCDRNLRRIGYVAVGVIVGMLALAWWLA